MSASSFRQLSSGRTTQSGFFGLLLTFSTFTRFVRAHTINSRRQLHCKGLLPMVNLMGLFNSLVSGMKVRRLFCKFTSSSESSDWKNAECRNSISLSLIESSWSLVFDCKSSTFISRNSFWNYEELIKILLGEKLMIQPCTY